MGFYERHVLPRIIDCVMSVKTNADKRAAIVPLASGVVLEIGIGSALNLPFMSPDVTRLYALDPSRPLWALGRQRVRASRLPVRFVNATAEAIPWPDATVDSVLSTWTLCSIPDIDRALREVRRVLRPGGRFVFIEHGQAPDPGVRAWQDRLNPFWKRIGGGCNLNRPIDRLIADAGFRMTQFERGYADGPRLFAHLYRGVAEPAGG